MKLFVLYFAGMLAARLIGGHHAPVFAESDLIWKSLTDLRAERIGAVDLLYRARTVGAQTLAGDDDFVEPLHDEGHSRSTRGP